MENTATRVDLADPVTDSEATITPCFLKVPEKAAVMNCNVCQEDVRPADVPQEKASAIAYKVPYGRQQSCMSVESLISQTSATNSLGAAVLKLANGILDTYEPDVRKVEGLLGELTVRQDTLLSKIANQNQRFDDVKKKFDLEEMASMTKLYLTKLGHIKKEMCAIQERVVRVKKRAMKLQQIKEKEALHREQERERALERERQMIAKPVKKK